MSVVACIDGRPAEQSPKYRTVLTELGPLPDESQHIFELWTEAPKCHATAQSVWLNPGSSAAAEDWLQSGGAVVESRIHSGASVDRQRQRAFDVSVRCDSTDPLDPCVLAAFLAHDFPLVDALMLARAYRGNGWPNDLEDYPLPVGGPASDAPCASFPRNAGLYAVVPTSEWVRRLAELQVPVVQLRDKSTDAAQRSAAIGDAVRAASGTGALLFINDDWQAAIQHRAYGVHLGQEDIEAADLRAIREAGLLLGVSTHGIYEMLRAHACKPSYIALGAIYATATKSMPMAPQGLRRLEHYVRLMSPHYPLVAIGGLDRFRIPGVWATGVDCAAVLRAIVDAPDYRSATADLLELTPRVACAVGPS
ncbi:MAG: thiamine phosphate synthase [Acidobacteriaceae bacterium]